MQYILPPLLPFQYQMYLDGQHFSHGRFFPLEYIKALLSLDEAVSAAPARVDTPEALAAYSSPHFLSSPPLPIPLPLPLPLLRPTRRIPSALIP